MPVNVGVGRVYVGAIVDADAQITESNEGNNVARDPRGVATGPDFTVTVATTLSSGPGEDLDVILGLATSAGLTLYLFYVLARPERF